MHLATLLQALLTKTCIKNGDDIKDEELDKYGVNNSLTHVDFMIGSNDMNIVGITHQGEEVQVFKDGNWAFLKKKD